MFWHNSRLGKTSNSAIDLTSLLDVIFIFLFIVIIGYFEASANKATEYTDLQQEVLSLQQQIAELKSNEYDYNALEQNYEDSLHQYDLLRKDVKVVQIFCNWNEEGKAEDPRQLRILFPDKILGPRAVTEDNKLMCFTWLEEELDKYISDNTAKRESNTSRKETEMDEIIILTLSTKNIQYYDQKEISKKAIALTEKYKNVFYREFN